MAILINSIRNILIYVIAVGSILNWSICRAQSIKVSSYGLENHTKAIERAMRSSGDTIIIDFISEPWVVDPLRFSGVENKVIVFEEGVSLWAKQGSFPNTNDALLTLIDCQNIIIIGNNTKLCMSKEDYVEGEWRHGISLLGSKNIIIKNY